MYVPIAVYKNSVVLIDSMDTFALYFCSSVKQRMNAGAVEGQLDYEAGSVPEDVEAEDETGSTGYSPEESFDVADDDDL
jgi:hypothetical protein